MSDRDDRIEHYYHENAWDLAEWLVDLEDELDKINRILRENGYEYPLGARGVADMANHRGIYLDEIEMWKGKIS